MIVLNGVSFAEPPSILATLKIEQGACPARVNPHSNGVVPMLLVGDTDFSVRSVIQEPFELRRCDGEGGCVAVVPPGSDVNNLVVQSNVSNTFVEVWPIDLNVDSDGFADFARSYVSSTVVDLRAPLFSEGRRFVRWNVSGVPQEFGVGTLSVRVTADTHLEAVYRRPSRVGGRSVLEPNPVVD